MTTWTDNGTRLDLGALGDLVVMKDRKDRGGNGQWFFGVYALDGHPIYESDAEWATRLGARRVSLVWLRRALQQAGKRLEVGK